MARFEEKIEVSTTDKVVFDILSDPLNYERWNLITDETKKIGENKYEVMSKIGKIFVTQKEAIPNERLSYIHEESPFNEVGQIIKPKADGVEVTLWGEFKDEKQLDNLRKSGEMFLKSLKAYAEYIEEGHNPEEFNKKEILISP